MTPTERWQLVQAVCAAIVAKYPDEIILGGVYGSTARGTDSFWSDVEMLFVVGSESKVKSKHFIFRGIALGYRVIEHHALKELLANPSLAVGRRWPFWMGMLSTLKVLYGDPQLVKTWLQLGQATPVAKFRQALAAHLPELVVESYGRILSCEERGNLQDIKIAVVEVLFEMNWALCLLNQSWVTHDYYQGLMDSLDFPKLPKDYDRLAPALWVAESIDEIVPLADSLVSNFWQLLADEGIQVANFQTVGDLPL